MKKISKQYFFILILQLLHLAFINTYALGAVDESPAPPSELKESFVKKLSSPIGIFIISTIGGLNAGILYKAASEQEEECARNIKKIEKIIASYKDSWVGFCPNGREKVEDPSCYCYLENNKKNTNRSNSQTCQDLWKKNEYLLSGEAGNYNTAAFSDPVGCVAVNGQFDENCKCRKLISSNGSNACMKSIGLNVANNSLGTAYVKASGVDKVMSNLASTTSGNSNLNKLDDKSLLNAINKQSSLNKALLSKLNTGDRKNTFPNLDSNDQILKYQNAIFKKRDLASLASTLGPNNSFAKSNLNNLPANSANIIRDAMKKAGLEFEGSGKGLNNNKENKKSGLDLNFSDNGSDGPKEGAIIDNFPEKNYKFKNSDIVTNEGASIFEIISNRYIQSGLKRLFDDEQVINDKK